MLNADNAGYGERRNALTFVLSGLARLAAGCESLDESVRARLQEVVAQRVEGRKTLLVAFEDYLKHPAESDSALAEVTVHFKLTTIEALATRLAIAAEHDILIGHLLSHLQQPLAGGRPTIGLIAQAYQPDNASNAIHRLGQGNAVRCGLLQLCGDDNPLLERLIRIPLANALALQSMPSSWPGASPIALDQFPVPLGKSAETRAAALAKRLRETNSHGITLVIRCGDSLEARAAAAQICQYCSLQGFQLHPEHVAGIAPWLFLNNLIPVLSQWLAPGERRPLPFIAGFDGPLIVLNGPDGDFDFDDRIVLDWRLETPTPAERRVLWHKALGDPALSDTLALEHRHTAGRIAALAAKARDSSLSGSSPTYSHIRSISRRGEAVGLGALAELIPDEVDDTALVVTESLRQELEALVTRCRLREQFSHSLGPSIQARYRPSVRALFVGPSGTGKTLAVAWLATRLGIPLYRVDLAAVTSKYIGETEKNLSQLLARAEQNEVLLLFDEADALFGKRTDIHEANDRFANSQTNYLLQRMESYDGITVLTSNGRGRFDDAFTRRFDAILSFPLPGPEERRVLWSAHLGGLHGVTSAQLNLLAALAELTGGQIRNAVLRSAVAAAQDGESILYKHLLTGVSSEYRKLSRQLPNELKQAQAAVFA